MKRKYNLIKKALIVVFTVSSGILIISSINSMKKSEDFKKNNDISSSILNNADFILGLKKVPQLEYAVGDSVINIHSEDNLYKTFEKNNKYEIFIDKKSEEINSVHYMSNIKSITDNDVKYLKNIYNLAFSSISSYMFDKTMDTVKFMCGNDYIANKNTSIVKNGSISESIIIGKTSEIKITITYTYNGSRNEPESIDIGILKGNKW